MYVSRSYDLASLFSISVCFSCPRATCWRFWSRVRSYWPAIRSLTSATYYYSAFWWKTSASQPLEQASFSSVWSLFARLMPASSLIYSVLNYHSVATWRVISTPIHLTPKRSVLCSLSDSLEIKSALLGALLNLLLDPFHFSHFQSFEALAALDYLSSRSRTTTPACQSYFCRYSWGRYF